MLVEFAFEFADFAAADAGYVDVIAGAMAFVEMAVAAEMQEVELVNEAVALQEIEGAIDGYASHARIEFLRALKDFVSVQVAAGGVHYLEEDSALASEANAAGAKLAFEMAGEFVIDAFAGGDAMCWCGGHVYEEIIPNGVNEREVDANFTERDRAELSGRYGLFGVAVLKAADLMRSGPSAGSTGFRTNLLLAGRTRR